MQQEAITEAAWRLLETTCLREEEVRTRLQQALSATYWRTLNPQLFVCGDTTYEDDEAETIDPRHRDGLVDRFAREGYFQVEPLIRDPVIQGMRQCVQVLRREGWPPVFAFVYDQFWLVPRIPGLRQLLCALLGSAFHQTSDFWTHYVAPVRGAAGWVPHKDYPGQRNRLTLWIPLSDATLENGCVSVIPKDLIPARILDNWYQLPTFDKADVWSLLQHSRALPARAGSVLCWDGDVIHWGLACTRAEGPRISFSVELIAGHEEPVARELPVFDVRSTLPTLVQRLQAIGNAMLYYQRHELQMLRYADLARQLIVQSAATESSMPE